MCVSQCARARERAVLLWVLCVRVGAVLCVTVTVCVVCSCVRECVCVYV